MNTHGLENRLGPIYRKSPTLDRTSSFTGQRVRDLSGVVTIDVEPPR